MAKTLKITFPHPVVYWQITTYDLSIKPVRVYAESDKSLWIEAYDKRHPNQLRAVVKQSAHLYPSWEEARLALVETTERQVRQYEREVEKCQAVVAEYKRKLSDAVQLQRPAPVSLVPSST